ncbi:MAG TPA: DUF3786 domain-containing protein [Anaerolineae bacterium]|nr:DUF3786 domain-containing protein [Anaerolineae bacterium]
MESKMPKKTYGLALEKAKQDLRGRDPMMAAALSGATYEKLTPTSGRFRLKFWGEEHVIDYPEASVREGKSGQEPSIFIQILILHYLINADGTPSADKWISFRELPGGRGFYPAFQQHASQPLARAFGHDAEGFIKAAEALGGERLTFGSASFLFRVFPRQWVAVVLDLADEEFPAWVNILFDAAASHYLPTEDWAVVSELLSSRLLQAANR